LLASETAELDEIPTLDVETTLDAHELLENKAELLADEI
jgi:hypothetical protein